MGLNNITLPASLITNLYPNSLVAGSPIPEETASVAAPKEPDSTASTEAPAETGWKSLGNNLRNILVVVKYPDILHLPDEDLSFLTNMLTACKLGLGDIALVNYEHYQQKGGAAITQHFKSRTVLLFGVEPSTFGLPVSFPAFQVQALVNVQYLFAPALGSLAGNKPDKSKLWSCLQKIFSI